MTATVSAIQAALPVQVDDQLPAVRTVVEDDTWDVELDVSRQVDLVAFFDAIADSFANKEASRRLMFNHKNPSIRRDALAELLGDKAIRAALTVTLDGGQAESLGILLDDASREPFERCAFYDLGAGCNNFVADKFTEFCGMHAAQLSEERHLDGGGPTPWDD